MRLLVALAALLLAAPAVALATPALSPIYLVGVWVEEGSGATCDDGSYTFTWDQKVLVGDEREPYEIKNDNEVHYVGVDSPTFDVVVPLDGDTLVLQPQNSGWVVLHRC